MIAVATGRGLRPSSPDPKIPLWVDCTCRKMSAWPPLSSKVGSGGRVHRFNGKPCDKPR